MKPCQRFYSHQHYASNRQLISLHRMDIYSWRRMSCTAVWAGQQSCTEAVWHCLRCYEQQLMLCEFPETLERYWAVILSWDSERKCLEREMYVTDAMQRLRVVYGHDVTTKVEGELVRIHHIVQSVWQGHRLTSLSCFRQPSVEINNLNADAKL